MNVMSSSNGIRIILWTFLAIIKGHVVRGQTEGPNAVALINGQTTLDCITNDLTISNWRRTPDGISNSLTIATGCNVVGNNSAYYRTEQQGGNICRLVIGNVTMQQAGVYHCYDGESTTYRSLVTVIDPVANVVVHNQSAEVVEGDQLNISCSINYNGPASPAPSLRPSPYWTTSPGQIFTSNTYHPSINVATLVANVTVQKFTVPIFQCKTVFEITGNTSGYNATAPADGFTVGNTKELDVQYSPVISNISSEGRNDSTNSCEISTVTCRATANPEASYTWIDIEEPSKIIYYGPSYGCAEFGRNYNCSATNIIRNINYTDVEEHGVREEYSTKPPCKGCHISTMNITGETCTDRICSCLLDCDMTVTCTADAYPEPTYEWIKNGLVIPNSLRTLDAINDGIYTCVAKNVIDECEFEARIDVEVVNCSYCGFTNWFEDTTVEMTPTAPSGNETDVRGGGENNEDWMIIVGVVLVYEIANLISMGFFMAYYNIDSDRNTNENNRNVATHKRALNNRFPWLERMLPCMNQSHASAGKKCLWIFLFSLITISCGVFIFPILIIIVKCCGTDLHGSQENSQLNLKLDDMSGSTRGGNRYPPPPSSLPPAPRLPSTSVAGLQRPIPPPNKPTRPPPPPAMIQQMNREGGAVEYAFLPVARRPNLAPAQYLDDDETSHYAILRRV